MSTEKICSICQAPATTEIEGHAVCSDCEHKVINYDSKRTDRAYRLHKASQKAHQEYTSTHDQAHRMASAIPFGQPILVGHHSERRDRNYRARIHSKFGKAFEYLKKAERLAGRAQAAENNHAISSDNPLAIPLLEGVIKAEKAKQEQWKTINATIRKNAKKPQEEQIAALVALDITGPTAARLLKGDFLNRKGIPDYRLRNNNGNIRRLEQRLKDLRARQAAVATMVTTEHHGHIKLTRDAEDNRLRLHFPGKPEASVIKLLKANGFIWSPKNTAWQRQLANAEWPAQRVLKELGVYVEPAKPAVVATPAPVVEETPAAPSFLPAEIAVQVFTEMDFKSALVAGGHTLVQKVGEIGLELERRGLTPEQASMAVHMTLIAREMAIQQRK